MIEQSLLLKLASPELDDISTSQLRQEYQAYQALFRAQPSLVQQYLATQAATLAEAVTQSIPVDQFSLPDQVVIPGMTSDAMEIGNIPVELRTQSVGGLVDRITHTGVRSVLVRKLFELEGSLNRAVSASAGLLRYTVARHMVYNMLPAGKSVIYASVEGDDIPNQPLEQGFTTRSTLHSMDDARRVKDPADIEPGEHWVPYVEAARRFYLPQWIAFDAQGNLLQGTVSEAEACILSTQQYLAILDSAIVVAPYMIADEVWQQKRYGMLGQLVNQGRALANCRTREIIQTIQRRVAEHKLDRGLRISLPYFDDQKLRLEEYDFLVIPVGRIMFIPAFAVLAAREQQRIVVERTSLSLATRKHLRAELHQFEIAFYR